MSYDAGYPCCEEHVRLTAALEQARRERDEASRTSKALATVLESYGVDFDADSDLVETFKEWVEGFEDACRLAAERRLERMKGALAEISKARIAPVCRSLARAALAQEDGG